jgi:hypothetical protein
MKKLMVLVTKVEQSKNTDFLGLSWHFPALV